MLNKKFNPVKINAYIFIQVIRRWSFESGNEENSVLLCCICNWLKTAIFLRAFPSSVVIIYRQELHIFLTTSVVDEVEISSIPLFCTHIGWMLVIVIHCFERVKVNKFHYLRSDLALTLILMHGHLHDLATFPPGVHWIGPRTNLGGIKKRNLISTWQESNTIPWVIQLMAWVIISLSRRMTKCEHIISYAKFHLWQRTECKWHETDISRPLTYFTLHILWTIFSCIQNIMSMFFKLDL
jgi:hypothetical protein